MIAYLDSDVIAGSDVSRKSTQCMRQSLLSFHCTPDVSDTGKIHVQKCGHYAAV